MRKLPLFLMAASARLSVLLAIFLLAAGNMSAYEERNMLRSQADEAKLKTLLIPDQRWVPFPSYGDRSGWDAVLGDWKETLIAADWSVSITWPASPSQVFRKEGPCLSGFRTQR